MGVYQSTSIHHGWIQIISRQTYDVAAWLEPAEQWPSMIRKTTNVANRKSLACNRPLYISFDFPSGSFQLFWPHPVFLKKVLMQSFAAFASAPSAAARCLSNVMSLVVAMIRTWCKAERWVRNMWLVARLCPGRGTSPWLLLMRADFTGGAQTTNCVPAHRRHKAHDEIFLSW